MRGIWQQNCILVLLTPRMHAWIRHIDAARKTYLVYLAVIGLAGCKPNTLPMESRPAIVAAFDTVWHVINLERFTESTKATIDSIISQYKPLTKPEQLSYYELLHWYYTTFRLGDYESANEVSNRALALFADPEFKQGNLDNYVSWMLYKGDALVRLSRLNEAYIYYYQVKSEFQDEWNARELSQFAERLGRVRYQQHNYHDAIQYYQEAFALIKRHLETESPESNYYYEVTEPQGLLNGIAWYYELLGRSDSAAVYYERALEFIDRESKRFSTHEKATAIAKAVVYGNLGGLHNKLGHYDTAEYYLTRSIAVNTQPGYDQRDLQTAQIKLADTYLHMERYDQARQLLSDSRKGLDTLYSADYEIRWRWTNWKLSEKQGTIDQSYNALLAYHSLKDSIDARDRNMFNTDFRKEFEKEEQQLAYVNLAFKNKLNFLAFVMSFVGLLFVLAIVYLVFANWKRSKRHIRRLNQLTDRINQRNGKLQLALLALQDSQQENTKLIAMVAHDLRTPLSNIQMALTPLTSASDVAMTAEHVQFLKIIKQSNDEALKLIGELLHSFEVKTPGDTADDIDLDAMLRDCVEFMQLRATQKEQLLIFEGAPAVVRGSREKIWRVVSNLIDNAIKFTPHEGEITVRLRQAEKEVVIEVHDNGIGIPPESKQGLFDIDNVPGRHGTDGEPSTGLGLAIVKQIVSAHKGRIHFESTPNAGTTFYVHLPH